MHPKHYNVRVAGCTIVILLSLVYLVQTTSMQCSRSVSFSTTRSITIQQSTRQSYVVRCGFWNLGRCTRYRTVYRTAYTTEYTTQYKTELFTCTECPEWFFTPDLCQKGECAVCEECHCNTTNSNECNKRDGSCSCNDGWYGDVCEDKCEQGMYGQHCKKECPCMMNNTISCDHDDGTCNCKPGWMGATCNQTCPPNYHGKGCMKQCTCDDHNTKSCDPLNGTCYCQSGWVGANCKKACSSDWYGEGCQDRCLCMPNTTVTCDQFNGTCYCQPGWTGMYCNKTIHDSDTAPRGGEGGMDVSGAVAGVVVIVVLVIIAGVVAVSIFIVRRRRSKGGKQSTSDQGHVLNILNRTYEAETSVSGNIYRNACDDIKEGNLQNGDRATKRPTYAKVMKKPKLKVKPLTNSAANHPNSTDDHPNPSLEHEYDVINKDVNSRPLHDFDDTDGGLNLVPADESYSGIDRTGKAYRQHGLKSETDYDNLGNHIGSESGTVDESIASNDTYSGVDRTGKEYRADLNNDYDKLKSDPVDEAVADSYSGVDRTGKAYRPTPMVAEIEYNTIQPQATEARPLQCDQRYDHIISRNNDRLEIDDAYGQSGETLSNSAIGPKYETVVPEGSDEVEYEIAR
ncbi:uncharacterized protein LOC144447319 [Glandiceps talaboti]